MKEGVLDILMYLFENYMDEETHSPDREFLKDELHAAGFHIGEINRAFEWLEGLSEQQENMDMPVRGNAPVRIFSPDENEKLDLKCRGFLLFLEQTAVLDRNSREVVIDRVMALDGDDVGLEQLKWVVLVVLFNQPGLESDFAWMENLVYEEVTGSLH